MMTMYDDSGGSLDGNAEAAFHGVFPNSISFRLKGPGMHGKRFPRTHRQIWHSPRT